jgi:hypothetical protein
VPAAQPALDAGWLVVMNARGYQALREVLYMRVFARVEESPWPTAVLQKGDLGGYVQLRPPAVDVSPLMPPAEAEPWIQLMWQHQRELSDLDVDVLDGLSTIWLQQPRLPQAELLVDVDHLLTLRRLQLKRSGQGRRGGYEPEQRAAVLKGLSHIQSLYVSISRQELGQRNRNGRDRPAHLTHGLQGRVFMIANLSGRHSPNAALTGPDFVFRPGEIFASRLVGTGRQIALLPLKALPYDSYRQTWAKRLARYLSWQWRIQARRGDRGDYLCPRLGRLMFLGRGRPETLMPASRPPTLPHTIGLQRTAA